MRLSAIFVAAAMLVAAPTHAEDVTLTRLEAAGGMMQWSFVPAGRHEQFGHAEMLVSAPVEIVRTQATDFGRYKDISNGRIRSSRLVDKRPGSTDVYLQVPVLRGMVTLWQILRFTDVRRASDGTESFTGTLVHGNVRAAEMSIRIRPAGAGRSVVECDLLVTPEFMAPQSVVDAELRDAASNIVRAFGRHAEQKYALLTPPPEAPTVTAVAIQMDAGASSFSAP